MYVRTLLSSKTRELIVTGPSASLSDAMDLLIDHGISCLPVLDDSKTLIGIISDKDIFKKVHETNGAYHDFRVEDIMTTEVIVGLPEDDINYIAGVMDKNWIQHVPIVEGENVVGIVSLRDVIRATSEKVETENRYLNMYMDMMHRRDQSGDN